MGVRLRNWDFLGVEDFLKHFAAAKRGRGEGGSAKWHSCAKRVFCRGGSDGNLTPPSFTPINCDLYHSRYSIFVFTLFFFGFLVAELRVSCEFDGFLE